MFQQAFPLDIHNGGFHLGMSLRDWFAGMAIGEVVRLEYAAGPRFIAEVCYGIADAMLAERDKEVRRGAA